MSFLGGMRSMSFGVMPSFDEFSEAFDKNVRGVRYRISGYGDYSGDYTAKELYALVKRIKDDWDGVEEGEGGALAASAIMSTLGFEWI